MQDECEASCGVCKPPTTATTPTAKPKSTKTPTATKPTAAAKPTPKPKPAKAAPAPKPPPPDPSCTDIDPSCAAWAASGECTKNPGFMFQSCALSCGSCDRGSRCAWNVSNTEPLGVPANSHHTFLERAESLGMRPVVRSTDPLVLVLDEFLDAEETEALRAHAAGLRYAPSEILQKKVNSASERMDYRRSAHRDSQTTFCGDDCYRHMSTQRMLKKARALTTMGDAHTEIQLLKYEVGQYYRTHHDYLGGSDKMMAGPRALTILIYLSDEGLEGGETEFPELNLRVAPKAGRAVLWPQVLNAEPLVKDVRTRHQSLPVTAGEKYAINLWYYHRSFYEARVKGCLG